MPRPPSDIAQKIALAARQRFLLEGVDGASLRQIAKDAGTNIGMIYYYFPTKDDLFIGAIEDIIQVFFRDLSLVLQDESPVEERLRRLFARLGRLSDDEALVLRIVLREALVSSDRIKRGFERLEGGHIPALLMAVLGGQGDGSLTREHHALLLGLSTGLLAVVPQIMRRQVDPILPEWLDLPRGEPLAAALWDILLRGISRRPTEPAP